MSEKLREFTLGVTLVNPVAAIAAYFGRPDYAVAILLLLNALWICIYCFQRAGRVWRAFGLLPLLSAIWLVWLSQEPSAHINIQDVVDQKTSVSVNYRNVPPGRSLWLAVKGTDKFWPYGSCNQGGGSIIQPVPQRADGTWKYPEITIGQDSDTGKEFTAYVLLVDESTDELLATEYQLKSQECSGKPWEGRKKLPRGAKVLAERAIRRR
jgi:hypothetical protein